MKFNLTNKVDKLVVVLFSLFVPTLLLGLIDVTFIIMSFFMVVLGVSIIIGEEFVKMIRDD